MRSDVVQEFSDTSITYLQLWEQNFAIPQHQSLLSQFKTARQRRVNRPTRPNGLFCGKDVRRHYGLFSIARGSYPFEYNRIARERPRRHFVQPESGRAVFDMEPTLSQEWSEDSVRGPQCAFEMSMFMCPAVRMMTRN